LLLQISQYIVPIVSKVHNGNFKEQVFGYFNCSRCHLFGGFHQQGVTTLNWRTGVNFDLGRYNGCGETFPFWVREKVLNGNFNFVWVGFLRGDFYWEREAFIREGESLRV